MGVPLFFSWLMHKHPACVTTITTTRTKDSYANLYLDLNAAIFVILERRDCPQTFSDFYKEFLDSIDRTVKMVSPNKLVFLALDGRPPRTKVFRRISVERDSDDSSSNSSSESEREDNAPPAAPADRFPKNTRAKLAMVRHGTCFMEGLETELRRFVELQQAIGNPKLRWIVSDSEEDGEGEHKIFRHIRSLCYNAQDVHCIVGRDADLIMLALGCAIAKKLHILRQTPNRNGVMGYKLVRLDKLVRDLEIEFCREACSLRLRSALRDFVFICFFLGNDFFPGFYSLSIKNNGIELLEDSYRDFFNKSKVFIVRPDGEIDKDALDVFLCILRSRSRISENVDQNCAVQNFDCLEWCSRYYFNGVVV